MRNGVSKKGVGKRREEMRDTSDDGGSGGAAPISTGRDRGTHILSVTPRRDAIAFGDAFTSAAIANT